MLTEEYSNRKKNKQKRPPGIVSKILKWAAGIIFFLLVIGVVGGIIFYMRITEDLPTISKLEDYHPPIISTVYADDGRKIAEYYKERRVVIPLTEMPPTLINAFIAAEDSRFYSHPGIDYISIVRAFLKNIEAGAKVQGGSTITQQVTKSFLLSPERTYTRKIKEALLAYQIDKAFSKDDILYLYLNQIFLGHGAYGVEAAAENYFGKKAKELNLAECAMLAGLPQAPSRYSPFKHFDKAKERQSYVLRRMVEETYITSEEAQEAHNYALNIKPVQNIIEEVPYYAEHVRRYIEKKYGSEVLYREGLKVHTALNLEMQKIAGETIERGLRALDKRQGYRGPIKRLKPQEIESFQKDLQAELEKNPPADGKILTGVAVDVDDRNSKVTVRMGNHQGIISIEDMRWARKPNPNVAFEGNNGIKRPGDTIKKGDVIYVKLHGKAPNTDIWKLSLEQIPEVEGALLCIEPETGMVKAMVGGRDYDKSQFNRAIQSRRQPGSAFKALIYAAAIDKGFTPATEILDTAIVYNDGSNKVWKPQNYDKKFFGPTLVREALAKSRNLPTIRILNDIGIDYFISYAQKLGITSELYRDLSLALGSSGVSLLELVRAYSVFANKGNLIEPIFITKIIDRDDKVLENNKIDPKKVIQENSAYIITNLLQSVINEGTGRKVKALNRPAAGKTGTTNNLFDAWFIGYTPDYIAGIWIGFDEERSLGALETGGKAASPVWLDFMQKVLESKPIRDFEIPKGVVFSNIDSKTGLLAGPDSPNVRRECFKEGTEPRYAKRAESEGKVDIEDFLKQDM